MDACPECFADARTGSLPGCASCRHAESCRFCAENPDPGNRRFSKGHGVSVERLQWSKEIAAFAGDSEKAHVKGCEFVLNLSRVKKNPTDIVITTNGGYPLDQNIYQSVKGMTAAEANCKSGGVIIMVAGLSDGHGGESFCKMVSETSSPQKLLEKFSRVPRNETKPDQWEAQILCRILSNHKVIMVTDMCAPDMIRKMHMEHAKNFNEALARAFELKGRNATVSLIPDGVSVIVR